MNSYRNIGIALLTGALLLAGFAGNALAWQAAACTDISNQAFLTYSVGGVDQTNGGLNPLPSGNAPGNTDPTTFKVDSLVDLDVSLLSAQPLSATGVDQVLRFRVTNLGNDMQQYQLQLYNGNNGSDGDDFDMSNVRVYVDTNRDGVLNAGDTLLATIDGTPDFGDDLGLTGLVDGAGVDIDSDPATGNTMDVFVVSDVPPGQPSTETAAYALRAISYQADGTTITITGGTYPGGTIADNSCGNPVVVGDTLETNTAVGGVTDAAGDGAAYASGAYTVVAAGISVSKSVSAPLWDPINLAVSPQAIPGAYVQYTITIANAALSAPATLSQITDALATQLALDPDLNTAGPGTPENAANDAFKVVVNAAGRAQNGLDQFFTYNTADGVDFSAPTITATFATIMPAEGVFPNNYAAGELKAGESVILTFNAIIQ